MNFELISPDGHLTNSYYVMKQVQPNMDTKVTQIVFVLKKLSGQQQVIGPSEFGIWVE